VRRQVEGMRGVYSKTSLTCPSASSYETVAGGRTKAERRISEKRACSDKIQLYMVYFRYIWYLVRLVSARNGRASECRRGANRLVCCD
jgi:uncharacterized DUF497 family protein